LGHTTRATLKFNRRIKLRLRVACYSPGCPKNGVLEVRETVLPISNKLTDAIDVIERQNLDTKNRFALILLDSDFEIALKEFIVNRPQLFPPHEFTNTKISALFERRTEVIRLVRTRVAIRAN
jgi:hypothetical protein